MRAPLLKDTKLVFAGIPVTMVAAPERSPEVGLIEAYLIVEGIKPEEEDAHQRKPGMEWGGNGFFLGERLKKKKKNVEKRRGIFFPLPLPNSQDKIRFLRASLLEDPRRLRVVRKNDSKKKDKQG